MAIFVNAGSVQERLRRLRDEKRRVEADRYGRGDLKCQRLIALAREIAAIEGALLDARVQAAA